jgi:hypothetical protein
VGQQVKQQGGILLKDSVKERIAFHGTAVS